MPCPRTLVSQMEKEKCTLQAQLVEKINSSKYKCSLGVDIVTTKGLVHALMGVTAHIVSAKNETVDCFALSIVELRERHTGEYIASEFEKLLATLKIRREKVLRVVTDCGSNMVAAFFEPFSYQDEEQEPPVVWTHTMVDAEEVPINQLYGMEEEAPEDAEEDESEDAESHQDVEEEVHCSLPESQNVLQFTHNSLRVFRVIGKFAKSHRATKMLFVESRSRNPNGRGLKLLFPADTRWASMVLCYSRITRVRESLELVCQELDYPRIKNADFALMDLVVQVVHAFRGFMLKLQQQSLPTISIVLPGVQNLIRLLELKKTEGALPVVCQSLIAGLQRRFADVLNSGQPNSDPLYLAAACIDPVVQKRERYLDDNFEQASAAIRQMALSLDLGVDAEVQVLQDAENITEKSPYGFDIPPKRPRTQPTSQRDKLKSEIVEYKAIIESEDLDKRLEAP
ncbi:hypothetical protein AAVH_30907 [Aphelenchoides avenae]|nr:hypothetical protein AAVH_30907 [Aphelenchus avenae]